MENTSIAQTSLMVAEYERDYLAQMMNAINASLPQPINLNDPRLEGDQEQYFNAIKTTVVNHFAAEDPALIHNIIADYDT